MRTYTRDRSQTTMVHAEIVQGHLEEHFDIAAIRSLSSSIRGVTRRSYHGQQNGVPYRGGGGNLPEISPRDLNFSLCIRFGIEALGSMQGGLVSFNFPTRDWTLAAGDRIVFVTDGLIEASNPAGEPFGFERFESLLRAEAGSPAIRLEEAILEVAATATLSSEHAAR